MANRYKYQFGGDPKPNMNSINGFVSIGTGGLPNTPMPFPLSASGVYTGTSIQTGFLGMALLPGQATAGIPTGWVGGFSGTIGLYGAGVASVARIGTGTYAIQLSDDWCRLDSCQANPYIGVTGAATGSATGVQLTEYGASIIYHNVGLGNSQQNPTGTTGSIIGGSQKNIIVIQFYNGIERDLPSGGGFFLDVRVRDSTAGPQ